MRIPSISFVLPKNNTAVKFKQNFTAAPPDATTGSEKRAPYAHNGIIHKYTQERVEITQGTSDHGEPIETHTKYSVDNKKKKETVYTVDGDKRYIVSMVHYDKNGQPLKMLHPSGNGGAVILEEYNPGNNKWGKPREISSLHYERLSYQPKLAGALKGGIENIAVERVNGPTSATKDADDIKRLFPNTYGQPLVQTVPTASKVSPGESVSLKKKNIGVILSGGPAPGGHNVITGLYDALKEANSANKLYGFKEGIDGLTKGDSFEITDEIIDEYRNTGGFDLLGSSRKKLDKEAGDFEKVLKNCKELDIDTIVVIGGDDSNTNAGLLAEWMKAENAGIQVIGCPKTIDGDLQNEHIEMPFGFDTATKIYSETVGNIQKDAKSSRKYTHFIRLMGRSASHVVLEVALRAHPNIALISEEIEAKNTSLSNIVSKIANVIVARSDGKGDDGEKKNYGVILVPEGLLDFIPEVKKMNSSLSDILDEVLQDEEFNKKSDAERFEIVAGKMDEQDAKTFNIFPDAIKNQLLLPKDDHGNTQVAKIETEKLLMELVGHKLEKLKEKGKYNGTFSPVPHYLGYEGRCGPPSNFDSDYCYSLGYNAFALAQAGLTGYMSCIKGLTKPAQDWKAGGVPLTTMMNIEKRKGQPVPVIKKAMVDLKGSAYQMYLAEQPRRWALKDSYKQPGGVQHFGPPSVCDKPCLTLLYNDIPETDCDLLLPKDILEKSSRSFQTDEKLGRRVIKTVTPDGRVFVTKTIVSKEDKTRTKTKTYEIINGEYIERSQAEYDRTGKTMVSYEII